LAIAHELDEPDERRENVERLEARHDDRDALARANASKMPQPVIVAAWPAARNPSTRVPGISATISITGGMNLCAESTDRFGGRPASTTAAVATAVVSKPVPKNTSGSSVPRAISTACATL
jgi:hypothetical protein